MDVLFAISKHCRCGFNSFSRCMRAKSKWTKTSNTNSRGLSNMFRSVLNKKWASSAFNKYFRERKKIHKTNIGHGKESIYNSDFIEHLEKFTVNNICTDLLVPSSCKSGGAWRSIYVDLTKKGSMTYLIFVDRKTLYPEVFELGDRSIWKQTKRAFRDVFREYQIPDEIYTSEKVFFGSGKFMKFMKDHGIVTATVPNSENKLANVIASVKIVIHNSRFWHEELRKLRESIFKSLLSKEDKYVQADEYCEEEIKLSTSNSSSEDSSEVMNDVVTTDKEKYKSYPIPISTTQKKSMINPLLVNKQKEKVGKKYTNASLISMKQLDWMHCLRNIIIKTNKFQKNRLHNNLTNNINSTVVINEYPFTLSLARNVTRIHHCIIDQRVIPLAGIWKRTKKRLLNKISDWYNNAKEDLMFDGKYGKMFYQLSRRSTESRMDAENRNTDNLSGCNSVVLKLDKRGSGDNYGNGLISTDEVVNRFPIEILPYKYDNLFITQKDLNWKAVVVDVIERSSVCYCLFIDCASKFPVLFLQNGKKGRANVKFIVRSICRLWQIHGKPIEIHSPENIIFSSTKLGRFLEKYDIFFYYDSPFLRNDMNTGHTWMKYKNILEKENIYTELLRIQRKIGKFTRERVKREKIKRRQKTLFSLNKTTTADTTHIKVFEGILRKETISFGQFILWKKIMADVIHRNGSYIMIFIDMDTLYPEMKEIENSSRIHTARLFIRLFKNIFDEKPTIEEIHVPERWPFNIEGVIQFMERKGVSYYRQSRYFNGGHCVCKCLEHMKSLICQYADLKSAIYHCRKKPLPWLGISPQQLASGGQMNSLFDYIVPPWAEVIIDIFSHGRVRYLVVLDYDSLYPECFRLSRNVFTTSSFKIIEACKKAFSVLGCPSGIWTFDKAFPRSNSFLKFLQTRDIQHSLLTPQKERDTSSMLAIIRQKLTMTSCFSSAIASTREAYNHVISACPVRVMRKRETAVGKLLHTAIYKKKHFRFDESESNLCDIDLCESNKNN